MKPILYIQCNNNYPIWDFCYDAKEGAETLGIETRMFEDSDEIPSRNTNILVGSVEECRKWLERGGHSCPNSINMDIFSDFAGRDMKIIDFSELESQKLPIFLKPAYQLKAFTGFVCKKHNDYFFYSEGYEDKLLIQEVIDIKSEYRCYIRNGKIIGMRFYQGDSLIFPDRRFIERCVEHSKTVLHQRAYSMDFGVLDDGRTILIEVQDAWAIGNYGLDKLNVLDRLNILFHGNFKIGGSLSLFEWGVAKRKINDLDIIIPDMGVLFCGQWETHLIDFFYDYERELPERNDIIFDKIGKIPNHAKLKIGGIDICIMYSSVDEEYKICEYMADRKFKVSHPRYAIEAKKEYVFNLAEIAKHGELTDAQVWRRNKHQSDIDSYNKIFGLNEYPHWYK